MLHVTKVSFVLLKKLGFRARNPKFLAQVPGFSGATAGINANNFCLENHERDFLSSGISQARHSVNSPMCIYC